MTKYIHTLAILIILGAGAVLGSTIIQALAWTAPLATPTTCDSTKDAGCSAPINIGSTIQVKNGGLGLGAAIRNNMLFDVSGKAMSDSQFTKTLQVGNGNNTGEPADGKVLMAKNNDGEAYWASLSAPQTCSQDIWACTYDAECPPAGGTQAQTCRMTFDCPTANTASPNPQQRTCPNTLNNPPTVIITTRSIGSPDSFSYFILNGTDPDGDIIRYEIDWNDGTTAHTLYPAPPNFVNQGTSPVVNHKWTTAGNKEFFVKVIDNKTPAGDSGWVSHTFTIPTPVVPSPVYKCTGGCQCYAQCPSGYTAVVGSGSSCIQYQTFAGKLETYAIPYGSNTLSIGKHIIINNAVMCYSLLACENIASSISNTGISNIHMEGSVTCTKNP